MELVVRLEELLEISLDHYLSSFENFGTIGGIIKQVEQALIDKHSQRKEQ